MLKACKIGERTRGKLANFYVIVDYYKGGGILGVRIGFHVL